MRVKTFWEIPKCRPLNVHTCVQNLPLKNGLDGPLPILLPARYCDFNFGGGDRRVERVEVSYRRHVQKTVVQIGRAHV